MPWNLAEEEQAAIMRAVGDVLEPWMGRRRSTITWINEDGSEHERVIYPICVRADAPTTIKRLERVYGDIIDRGAVCGGPLPED